MEKRGRGVDGGRVRGRQRCVQVVGVRVRSLMVRKSVEGGGGAGARVGLAWVDMVRSRFEIVR